MAGPGTTFTGPLVVGPKWNADANGAANTGYCILTQQATIVQNSTTAVSVSFQLPPGSILHEIDADTTTAWNSVTSATLTVGTSAGDSTYAGGVSTKTAGRANSLTASFASGTQLNAWQGVGTTVVATITPVGTTSAGTTIITLEYIQTVQNLDSNI